MKETATRSNKNEGMQELVPTVFPRALKKASARLRNVAAPKDTATLHMTWVLKAMALVLKVLTMETQASV
jgi:hypothetical protein